MDFLTKLERKFGKYSIPNLTVLLIGGFIIGFMIEVLEPNAINAISLNPELILKGQIWRLISWVLMPPNGASLWIIITLLFYFSIGRTLENVWGDFRYTLYIISGIIFTDLGVIGSYLVLMLTGQSELAAFYSYTGVSTYFLCMSIFLAYAFTFPEHQVLLWFIIPVKVKWMGYLDIAYLIYFIVLYAQMHYFPGVVTVVMSILNFVVFYMLSKGKNRVSHAHKKRARTYEQEIRQSQVITRHKCAICGQTDADNKDLEFRYCSRCKGNYEYCNNHLFTHEHKK